MTTNPIPEDRALVYQAGDQEVRLTPSIVRKFLVSGSGPITEKEIVQFMTLCKYQGLNPFLRDAYLVKYGQEQASIITSKDFFLKRARSAADLEGYRAGVVVLQNGETKETEGLVPKDAELVGGWAEVYVSGWKFPVKIQISFDEYVGRKKDGSINSMWKNKPSTMCRKVALVQALREAFPGLYGGLYSPEEINTIDQAALSEAPVEVTTGEIVDLQPQEEAPARRSRRNTVTVNGKDSKTCGVTGEVLEQLKALRSQHPDVVNPIINKAIDELQISDTTFLRENEGQELLQAVRKAVDAEDEKGQGSDKDEAKNTQGGPGEQTEAPQKANGGAYIWCPIREQQINTAYCEGRCDKKEGCESYRKHLNSKEAE